MTLTGESIKSKYEKIREILVECYPKLEEGELSNPDYPNSESLERMTKDRIAAKLKTIQKNFKEAVDSRKRSGGARMVMIYYICNVYFKLSHQKYFKHIAPK